MKVTIHIQNVSPQKVYKNIKKRKYFRISLNIWISTNYMHGQIKEKMLNAKKKHFLYLHSYQFLLIII